MTGEKLGMKYLDSFNLSDKKIQNNFILLLKGFLRGIKYDIKTINQSTAEF